jgi:hypothetical protein
VLVAQKQIWRPVEQNRRPGYDSTQLCPPYFWPGFQKHTMEKRQPFQKMLQGKVSVNLQKTESRSMPVTLYFYQLKVNIKDFNIRPKILQLIHKRSGNTLDLL